MVAHGNSLPFNGKSFVSILFSFQVVTENFPVFRKLAGVALNMDHSS
jgi:hypothetical protein